MRFPVRVFFRWLSSLLILFLLLPTFVSVAHAQTPIQSGQTPIQSGQTPPPAAYQLVSPNINPDVPRNQHTFVQSIFLETLLAIQCQITGIDLSNPTKSCLGIDLKTGKFGYAPTDPSHQGTMQIGGLLGAVNHSISYMYTPTFGSHEYFQYLSDNFGLVKQTHAAAYTGFQGLQPILSLWKVTRDLSYYLLIIAFIFIGVGVMLRVKIDPRTVMTVQNQIPRVIICIILITFSYAFAGLMIDTMWAITYMGINKITSGPGGNPQAGEGLLSRDATRYILSTPYGFTNQIYDSPGAPGGVLALGGQVGSAISNEEGQIITNLFTSTGGGSCPWSPAGCMNDIIRWIFTPIWFVIVTVALLIALFRIWWDLLKAYLLILVYVILGPIWIVFGLLPKRPLGFEKWLRILFSNLAVFPAVVLILVGARVLHETFGQGGQYRFVPPLIGNPDTGSFGSILEFAMLLMAPQLLSMIREKLGVPPNKQVGAALGTFNAARSAVGAPVKQGLKHLNKRDAQGNAIGFLAQKKDAVTGRLAEKLSWVPGVKSSHDRSEAEKQEYGGAGKYNRAQKDYGKEYKGLRDAATQGKKGKEYKKALEDFEGKNGANVLEYAKTQNQAKYGPSYLPAHLGGTQAGDGGKTPMGGAGRPGAAGAVPPSPAGGPPTPPAAGTGQPAKVIITINTPEGDMTIPVQSGQTIHEAITRHIESIPSEQRSPVVQQITTHLAEMKDDLNVPAETVTTERAQEIGDEFSRHLRTTGTPKPAPEGGEEGTK